MLTLLSSGAGNPPHQDTKDTIRFPWRSNLSRISIAPQWSIPGSRPISLSRRTSAAMALRIEDHEVDSEPYEEAFRAERS